MYSCVADVMLILSPKRDTTGLVSVSWELRQGTRIDDVQMS